MIKPAFMMASLFAMQLEQTIDPASSDSMVRYALTQGGLLSLLIVLGWSYRRDFMQMAELRQERISVLTEIVSKSTEAQTRSAEALIQSTAALSTQAQSIHALSQAVGELKGAIAGRHAS